jgi:hypothetical protein
VDVRDWPDEAETAPAAQALTNPKLHYAAWMNSASPPLNTQYVPPSSYSRNVKFIKRTSVGNYEIRLAAKDLPAAPIAVAYGSDNRRCKVKLLTFTPDLVWAVANVYCHTPAGLAADSRFVFSGFVRDSNTSGRFAMGHVSSSGIASAMNSVGSVSATRVSTGTYEIVLTNLGLTGGMVQVGAFGSNNNHCKVTSWSPVSSNPVNQKINVRCFLTNSSSLANTAFHFVYDEGIPSQYGVGAYTWANNATSLSYNPSPTFTLQSGAAAGRITHTAVGGLQQTLGGGQDTGHYKMNYTGFGGSVDQSYLFVGAYGTGSQYCKILNWFPKNNSCPNCTVETHTLCFDSAGNRTNTLYVQTFGSFLNFL